jgi:hypothetical protein
VIGAICLYLYVVGAIRAYQIQNFGHLKMVTAIGWPVWDTLAIVIDIVEWYQERP